MLLGELLLFCDDLLVFSFVLIPNNYMYRTRTDEELHNFFHRVTNVPSILEVNRLDLFRYSTELKSEMARRLNYLVPPGLRWITQPIFSSIFDKKIMNYDTEHFKKVKYQ